MRVLVATPLYPPDIGGPATYAAIVERAFPEQGVETEILSFGSVRGYPKAARHMLFAAKVLRRAREVDVILALDPVSVGLPVAMASRASGVPYVVKVVGDYAWEQGRQRFGVRDLLDDFIQRDPKDGALPVRALRTVQSSVARGASAIIVPSDYLGGVVRTWGVSPEKVIVVPNAFAPHQAEHKSREEIRSTFHLPGRFIVSAGRLAPWKGFGTLIEILPRLRERFPDLSLLIAGSGPDESRLRLLIAKSGQAGVVRLLGTVPREELLPLVAAADCFVLNTGYEGLSHQLLEVMSLGAPIVTTWVGGNPELIEDGRSGILVGYDDRALLRSGIERMLADDSFARGCVAEAKRVASSFTVERMVDGTLSVLRDVARHSDV